MKTKLWSVFFDTKDGMIHPLRLEYSQPVTRGKARIAAREYLARNTDWLKRVADIQPKDPPTSARK